MKITRLETLRLGEFPNLVWLRLHTDQGLAGLGETFFAAASVEAYLHEFVARRILGRDPFEIDACTHGLAGYRYVRDARQQTSANRGLEEKHGPYEDLDAFLHRADELAQSLLESGITGMKIWPFDTYAEASNGLYISPADLEKALEPFRRIRRAVGNRMDIMVEFHSLWQLPAAQAIARSLGEFDTYWHEDPIRMDSLAALKQDAPHRRARAGARASGRAARLYRPRGLRRLRALFDPRAERARGARAATGARLPSETSGARPRHRALAGGVEKKRRRGAL